ncbi:MAG: ATP-binding protein [Acidimicrobiia bacterium]
MTAATQSPLLDRLGLHRRSSRRVVAGVAGGIADRLGVPDGYVRAALVVLAAVWGMGAVLYLALWVATFDRAVDPDSQPDLREPHQQLGLAMGLAGGLLVLRSAGIWPGDRLVIVVAALAFGMAAVWDRGEAPWLGRLLVPNGTAGPGWGRALAGAGLVIFGLGLLFTRVAFLAELGNVVLAVLVTGLGLVMVLGPWLWRMGQDLVRERRERIRQEERAEVAAHLHDSVLQTLALIQRTEDPRRMLTLARAQERELRAWLYGRSSTDGADRLSTALRAAADRVEADHHLPVEVVTVGDLSLGPASRALAAAAAEAMVNAAKHSGAGRVSVYLEVLGDRADVWVSDQGSGFDPAGVPGDRRGITHSIIGRMKRHRGGAEVTSDPGEGAEVHLWLEGIR